MIRDMEWGTSAFKMGIFTEDNSREVGLIKYLGKAGGKGKYKWVNGEEYDGDWKDGFKNGKGIWKSNKGDQYVGDWVKGKAEGNGVHVWSNGKIKLTQATNMKESGSNF